MPRRCAAITSRTAVATAAIGSSATSLNTPGRSLYVRLHGPDRGPGAAGKWTDAATGEHGDLLDLIALNRDSARLARRHRRGALLPCSAASGRHRSHRVIDAGADRFIRGRPPPVSRGPPDPRHAGRSLSARPRHHRTARLARLALPPLASITARPKTPRSKPGRRCSPRSPISTAGSPASSAPGSIPGVRPRRRSPIRAGHSAICSAMASASDAPPTSLAAGEGHRNHARPQIRAAHAADDRRALGQSSRRPRIRPGMAPPLCRARQRRGRSQRGEPAARTRARPSASMSATSCPSMPTSTSISAVSARRRCSSICCRQLVPSDVGAFHARDPITDLRGSALNSVARCRAGKRRVAVVAA